MPRNNYHLHICLHYLHSKKTPMSTFIIKSGVVLFLFAHHPRGSTNGARKRTEKHITHKKRNTTRDSFELDELRRLYHSNAVVFQGR